MNFSSTSGSAVEEHVPTAFPCNDRRACSRSVPAGQSRRFSLDSATGLRLHNVVAERRAAGEKRRADQAFRRGSPPPRKSDPGGEPRGGAPAISASITPLANWRPAAETALVLAQQRNLAFGPIEWRRRHEDPRTRA